MNSYPLLPDDSALSDWQRCMKKAIIRAQSDAKPYGQGPHGGVTHDVMNRDRVVSTAKGFSYCNGATYQVFIEAFNEWVMSAEDSMTYEQAREMRAHFYAYGDKDSEGKYKYSEGSVGGLRWLKKQEDFTWIDCEFTTEPNEFKFGDFVSIQTTPEPMDGGHSAIVVGKGIVNGKEVLYLWSSTDRYDAGFEFDLGLKSGNGFDYYTIGHVKNGFERVFRMGRIVD